MGRFRFHRGGLAESMDTMIEVADRAELDAAVITHLNHLNLFQLHTGREASATDLSLEIYDDGPDTRIGWPSTWVVTAKGWGVVGFADGDLPRK